MIDGPARVPPADSDRRAANPASADLVGGPPDAEVCEAYSPRKGCYGGERAKNPNWSPRKGYFGGGGPADQRREEEERHRAAAGPGQMVNCDRVGCWRTANGVRYNRAAGGNLTGANGQFCVRAGNTFNCS